MRVLHAGCGNTPLPEYIGGEEVRLDIDPSVCPDIVSSMTDIGDVGEFDGVFTSHALEHLYPHQVEKALREFRRVLKDGCFAVIIVPDLEGLELNDETLYEVNGFKISALDMFYGHRAQLEEKPYMAHHTGFTLELLTNECLKAGFSNVIVKRCGDLNLLAVVRK